MFAPDRIVSLTGTLPPWIILFLFLVGLFAHMMQSHRLAEPVQGSDRLGGAVFSLHLGELVKYWVCWGVCMHTCVACACACTCVCVSVFAEWPD